MILNECTVDTECDNIERVIAKLVLDTWYWIKMSMTKEVYIWSTVAVQGILNGLNNLFVASEILHYLVGH